MGSGSEPVATIARSRNSLGKFMAHHCHARGCYQRTNPSMFMCRAHWFMLPVKARDAIWKTYRIGQEVDKNPSAEYLRVTDKAIEWLYEFERKKHESAPVPDPGHGRDQRGADPVAGPHR